MDQANLLMQRQRSSNDRHAAGMADVHRDCVRSLLLGIFVPLDEEFHARNDALVSPHLGPTIFQTIWLLQYVYCHGEPHCGKISSGGLGHVQSSPAARLGQWYSCEKVTFSQRVLPAPNTQPEPEGPAAWARKRRMGLGRLAESTLQLPIDAFWHRPRSAHFRSCMPGNAGNPV